MTFADTMQAFSSFAWMPDFMQPQNHEKMACSTPRPNPVANMPPQTNNLKRKRMDRNILSSSPEVALSKRQKHVALAQAQTLEVPKVVINTPVAVAEDTATEAEELPEIEQEQARPNAQEDESSAAAPKTRDPHLQERARQQVEAHFNLEILYKHNELRLIEQEMAKCQVALEQLRRCNIISFPGQPGSTATPEQIASGTGPSVNAAQGYTQPQDPAAWGVTDGPYSRHYAQWLIPDPRFDPRPIQEAPRPQASGKLPSRNARAATTSEDMITVRSGRRATAAKLQGLPNYAAVRDRNTTLTIRRASDGLLVKLICRFCGKDNVSSLQGFLNHCRIQHKHEYASHNAALEDCGVPLDEVELASLNVSEVEQLPTSSNVVIAGNNGLLVHPLIRENRRESPAISTLSSGTPRAKRAMQPPRIPSGLSNSFDGASDLKPSPSVPGLSAYLAKLGSIGNLSSFVEHTKDRSDFENICEQLQSDEEEEPPKPATKPKSQGRSRGRRSTVHAAAGTNTGTQAPLRLQLPAQRAVQLTSEASPYSTTTDTPPLMTASTSYAATPGLLNSATDYTMSPAITSAISPNIIRAMPGSRTRSDISGFTSTFGHTPTLVNSSSGIGTTISPRTSQPQADQPSSQRVRPLILKLKTSQHSADKNEHGRTASQPAIPATPATVDTSMSMDFSPANTADTNPGMVSDNEENYSYDEDLSEVNVEHMRKPSTAVRIRSSLDNTSFAETQDERKGH